MLIVEDVEGVLPLRSLEDIFIVTLKEDTAFAVMILLPILRFFSLNPFLLKSIAFSPSCAESESDCFLLFLCGIHLCSCTVSEELTDFSLHFCWYRLTYQALFDLL